MEKYMKKIFLFTTRLRVYWVLLPIIALFTACVCYNQYSDEIFKLYPLMAVLAAGMIFILIYFFQGIKIGYDEIRYIGLFSSRDFSMIKAGKKLIIRELSHGKLEITLFGNDGVLPELDWVKTTGDAPRDISLFRGTAFGGERTVLRITQFFGLERDDAAELLSDCVTKKSTLADFSVSADGDGRRTFEILITKTV